MIDLTVIIVNYRSTDHVLNCLQSIYTAPMHISFEVIVVDNDSQDDSESIITKAFTSVIWIQSNYNSGFARANNLGIRRARGRNILLLNADTIIQDNALEKTVKLFDQHPEYAACGLQLLNPDETHQHSGAKFIYGGLNFVLPLPYLGNLARKMGYASGMKQHNVFSVTSDAQVDWIVGAFIMIKKDTIGKAGLLDEDFFMYAEEIEWCARIRKINPLILFSQPKVIHLGGGSSGSFYNTVDNDNSRNLWNKKARQILLSQLLRIRRQWGLLWFLLHLIVYLFEIPLFAVLLLSDKIIHAKNSLYRWDQFKGYTSNILSLIPFIPSLIANRHIFYKIK